MGILTLLLLLLFWLFSTVSTVEEGESSAQSCAVSDDGRERCGPTIVDDQYQIPSSGTVIAANVNNGPLPPEYQEGYEITIDASGRATVVVTPAGASASLGDAQTAEPITTTIELGFDGLQRVLQELDATGVFFLTPADEIEEIPDGSDVSILTITLEDGSWEFSGAGLPPDERATLDEVQRIITTAVGLDPDDPISVADATPTAA